MSDEFLEEYVLDTNDQLAILNESLLKLEENPKDKDAINCIFRAAHTLKGNSATMGFMDISSLAHKMENILDAVRAGKFEIKRTTIDSLFETLDALEAMVESASNDGVPKDCSKIISRLDSILCAHGEVKKLDRSEEKRKDEAIISGSRTFKIRVGLSKSTSLKSVRAFMILKNLSSLGKVVKGEPGIRNIEEGEFEDEFTVYLNTDSAPEEIENQIKKVAEVESFSVQEETSDKECKLEKSALKEVKSIRVGTDKLDTLVNLVGELVINKSRMSQVARDVDNEALINALLTFENLTRDLQDTAMSMRMVKVAHVFDKFPRMVRDLARKEGKEVEFIVEGKEIELDRTVLDRLGDPLVHLLRNCVDHGLESTEERTKAGKKPKGVINLSASRVKDHVEIVIEDDGKGIDPESIKEAVIKKGLIDPDKTKNLSSDEIINFIFMPGLSGAKKVTDVSGRGVGMDVVKTTISKLGGSIHVSSNKGLGTQFTLKLPLSLAIIKALLVNSKENVIAIPTKDVAEVLSYESFELKSVNGKEAIIHRGTPLPVLRLNKLLNSSNGEKNRESEFIIVEKSNQKLGLAVEKILKQEEIVVRPLERDLGEISNISGATILGDGKVALILDVHNLI
jgi:two-component system chemotaxis sensor kinase CheA